MKKVNVLVSTFFILALSVFSGCNTQTDFQVSSKKGLCPNGNDLTGVSADFANALLKYTTSNNSNEATVCTEDVDNDGTDDNIVVISSNIPEHESSYFDTSNILYEYFDYLTNQYRYPNIYAARASGVNDSTLLHSAGNNHIQKQTIILRMPINPTEASTKTNTTYSTIGLALNGVSFFNENAAPSDDIRDELFTFDQCSGHPQQSGIYHYHVSPVCLIRDLGGSVITKTKYTYSWIEDDGNNANLLLGFLMDGFPVYGPIGSGGEKDHEGNTVTTPIDQYNGHIHSTTEFSQPIYHYHVKTANVGGTSNPVFWITNAQYYGVPGSVTVE